MITVLGEKEEQQTKKKEENGNLFLIHIENETKK